MPTVHVTINDDEYNYLLVKAGNDGFRRNKPHQFWGPVERIEAQRFALKRLIREDMERNVVK